MTFHDSNTEVVGMPHPSHLMTINSYDHPPISFSPMFLPGPGVLTTVTRWLKNALIFQPRSLALEPGSFLSPWLSAGGEGLQGRQEHEQDLSDLWLDVQQVVGCVFSMGTGGPVPMSPRRLNSSMLFSHLPLLGSLSTQVVTEREEHG